MTARARSTRVVATLAGLTLALGAAGCADQSGGGGGGGGESVEIGADKQAYIDALADMDEVTLAMQSTAPQGAATGRRFEQYAAAVEEWSGGKITFDITYSNGIAPPDEVDDALADGRLDIGSVIVALEPDEFPVSNVLWDLSYVGSQQPVRGILEWHGAMIQAAVGSDAVEQEFDERGMHLLLPTFSSGSYFLNCADQGTSLDDFDGRTIASQSRVQSAETEALGMSPSTLPYAEMFESLERGVIDCAASTLTTSTLGGFIPQAPYFAYSSETGIASPGGSIAISADRWDTLPLAAQQLLHDRMDVVLEANFGATWENVRDGMAAVEEAGGSIEEVDADVADAIAAANEDAAESAREADADLVDSLLDAESEWSTKVDDLGLEGVDVGYDEEFLSWLESDSADLEGYFAELADVMSAQRPS